MSMSTHVIGFKPADEKWLKMKAVHDACTSAGLPVPDEVTRFFDWRKPDEAGVEVKEAALPLTEWCDGYRNGYELDVTKLDPDIKIIRFFNSW